MGQYQVYTGFGDGSRLRDKLMMFITEIERLESRIVFLQAELERVQRELGNKSE